MVKQIEAASLLVEGGLNKAYIKVLSLFFVDTVEHYHRYGEHGAEKDKYALMFEDEYCKAAARPKYRGLFKGIDLQSDAAEVHDGNFAIDKKGREEIPVR